MIELDFQEQYGIDLQEPNLLDRRTWDWLANRITGLLTAPALYAPDGRPYPATRLGWRLTPPPRNTND